MKKLSLSLVLCLLFPFASLAADLQPLDKAGLTDLLAKNRGKTIMLNFFATWCPPCAAEIPELVKLRNDYPDSKLVVIGLSVDEDKAAVPPFLQKAGVNYPVYLAGRDITDSMNISSVPHNVFFEPGGVMVISEPGIANLKVLKDVVDNLGRSK